HAPETILIPLLEREEQAMRDARKNLEASKHQSETHDTRDAQATDAARADAGGTGSASDTDTDANSNTNAAEQPGEQPGEQTDDTTPKA
ncbi:MAG: hypothetical protein PUB74_04655, partial [Bifidobacterium boum]|nr:hypothetical protein [Bifidobacterium boum]